mgnify:CR=1 FL=1
MKELKTKKSAEGARVKEKSDALPRAAKRMLRAGLMERQASRQRDTQEKAPERAAEEQVERAALRGCGRRPGGIQAGCASAGRTGKGPMDGCTGSRPLSLCITGRAYRWCGTENRENFPKSGNFESSAGGGFTPV